MEVIVARALGDLGLPPLARFILPLTRYFAGQVTYDELLHRLWLTECGNEEARADLRHVT